MTHSAEPLNAPDSSAVRLPRRRRTFYGITEDSIRSVISQMDGFHGVNARVRPLEQGINNRTHLVEDDDGPALVLKVRPRPGRMGRNSPEWPHYTQELFGPFPNGDISTLAAVTGDLRAHGKIRVPALYRVDESLELMPAPYMVSEWLPGSPFNWDANPITAIAARQMGDHLGSLHRATQGAETWGIYSRRRDFTASDWWPRFSRAYRTIWKELARSSSLMEGIKPQLEKALQRAVGTGVPGSFALICVDQSPTHYLRRDDGGIGAMVDVEAHLWAPAEYELAMTELWIREPAAFRLAYQERQPWPTIMDQVRPAYWFFTWMEWIYCLYTLLHDRPQAVRMERRLAEMCEELVPDV